MSFKQSDCETDLADRVTETVGNHSGIFVVVYPSVIARKMAQEPDEKFDDDLAVDEASPMLKRPPLYKVFLLNDDFTPMEFVVDVLKIFFGMDEEKATQVMLHVHMKGIGVCGVFSRDIAETKVRLVNEFSREHQHPLMCDMDEA